MVNYTVLNYLIDGSNPLAYKIRNIYFFFNPNKYIDENIN